MWVTAFVLGMAGSLHCVGMCSPLAWMVTGASGGRVLPRLIYNLGRIMTYSILGLMASAVGTMVNVPALQFTVSVSLGILLITLGLGSSGWVRISVLTRATAGLTLFLKSSFSAMISANGMASKFLLGMINGILPCGLTYVALSSCFLQQPADGFLFMAIFGAGTLPAMIGVPTVTSLWVSFARVRVNRFLPILLILVGGWLVARGYLNEHQHMDPVSEAVQCP